MEKDLEIRIEALAREKQEGKSYSEIRAGTQRIGHVHEEISSLIRQVDEKVLENAVNEGKIDKAQQMLPCRTDPCSYGTAVSDCI